MGSLSSLAQAIKYGKLAEFADQEEKRGVRPIDLEHCNDIAAMLIKAPQSKNPTSRSSYDDGSSETEPRRDNDLYISD